MSQELQQQQQQQQQQQPSFTVPKPTNSLVGAMLTDLYQITMCYAYWKAGRQNEESTFDLFFRKNPFQGEFTVFAGLDESLRYIAHFKFEQDDLQALHHMFPHWEPEFIEFLGTLDTSQVKVYSIAEGTIVFPRVPLLRIQGPLCVCQLLETTLLLLINYACLVCTNAARHRLAAGWNKSLFEFGLRRAQGPDGGLSASHYSYMGGFDGTSNVKAAVLWGMAIKGTHAHSFVSSYVSMDDLHGNTTLRDANGEVREFAALALKYRSELKYESNLGELAAYIAYAQAYPTTFLALVDTYDTLSSGVPNFLCVALALHELGHKAAGIRLDSGDLAYLSKESRRQFVQVGTQYGIEYFSKFSIIASNDLNESVLYALKEQGHEIDGFGVGTNLVTCQSQPALGGVYKLVEINGKPRIKVSQDVAKMTVPGRKEVYRLYDASNNPILDLMCLSDSPNHDKPVAGQRILCRHPFDEKKRVYVIPSRVEPLHQLVWDGKLLVPLPGIEEIRNRCIKQLQSLREDHLRLLNPTPYKVSLTKELHHTLQDLWEELQAPIVELK